MRAVRNRSTYIRRRIGLVAVALLLVSAGVAGADAGTETRSAAPPIQAPATSPEQLTEGRQAPIPATCEATADRLSCSATLR